MRDRSTKHESGFSLLEMVIAMAVGTIVLGAAVQIYSQGVNATWTTTQRAEMQQDFRAASNALTKDLSMAGSGLGPGAAIALPSTTTPVYGCDQTGTCYINGAAVTYPKQGTTAYLYGLLPGYRDGPTLLAAQGATDAVTSIYTDATLPLDCYTAAITSTTTVTFTLPSTTSANCTATGGNAGVVAVNDAAVGLTAGDLVWFTFTGPVNIVAEVTAVAGTTPAGTVPPAGSTYTVTFAAGDVLKMNQAAAVANSLASKYVASPPAAALTSGYANRILVISYYINNTTTPPRLMQQISGHTPVPVAENVVYFKLSYDLFNGATNTPAVNQPNPGSGDANDTASNGLLPNQITKVNILNMAMNSTLSGSQFGLAKGYQGLDLQTSVCARNLTYVNNYPN
ncbi:MAG: prepilin-type N-terminal cleavage/methylation domain-containing protein [Terriglobales bacterium]